MNLLESFRRFVARRALATGGGRQPPYDERVTLENRREREAGWTLIEMLVVVSLVMILASLALTQYRNSVTYAKESALRANLFTMREAIDQYYADKAKYPDSLETLVSERYLRAVPKDPITQQTDWETVQAEPEPGIASTSTGIYDVKSTAPNTSLDGSRFSDW
jgi:general secretion pathway protein G